MVLLQRRFVSMLPEIIEADISRDMEHPRHETAVVAERVTVFQDPKEHFLGKIVRNGLVACHSKEEIEQRAVMTVEEYAKFRDITALDGLHEVLVTFRHARAQFLLKRIPPLFVLILMGGPPAPMVKFVSPSSIRPRTVTGKSDCTPPRLVLVSMLAE